MEWEKTPNLNLMQPSSKQGDHIFTPFYFCPVTRVHLKCKQLFQALLMRTVFEDAGWEAPLKLCNSSVSELIRYPDAPQLTGTILV